RRRQVDEEAADRARIAIAVVDDDDLAASAVTSDPPQQVPVRPHHGDDLRSVGTDHDGAVLAVNDFGADIAGTVAEPIQLVVANELLAAGITNDDAAGFRNDGAAALLDLAALAAEVVKATRTLRGRARRDRRQRGGRRRNGGKRRSDRGRAAE